MGNSSGYYVPKWFKAQELVPRKVYEKLGEQSFLVLDDRIMVSLDAIRDHFGHTVVVNNWADGGRLQYRGFRDDSYYERASVGLYSQHRFGRAADFNVEGVLARDVRDEIVSNPKTFPLIRAIEKDVPWVHVDCRCYGPEVLLFGADIK